MVKYKHAILGGTFDYLHAGHKRFIDAACQTSKKVTIGITTGKLLKQKIHKDAIQGYKVREKALKDYLKSKALNQVSIIPLSNIIGAGFEKDVDAIFAIDESHNNARIINKERIKRELSPAKIIIVPMLKARDGGLISSKRIRSGEIDRDGNSYFNLFRNTLKLPEELRPVLRRPFGKIIKNLDDYKKISTSNNLIIAVGDIVVSNFMKIDYQPNISIVDLKTQRQPITDKNVLKFLPTPDIKSKNEPSTVGKDSAAVLNSILRKSITSTKGHTIQIEGEEDLLAIPAILLSPLESIVLYGIREVGGIMVRVTEEKKEEVKRIVAKFDILNST